jgi:hypothetical protein
LSASRPARWRSGRMEGQRCARAQCLSKINDLQGLLQLTSKSSAGRPSRGGWGWLNTCRDPGRPWSSFYSPHVAPNLSCSDHTKVL